MSALDLSDQPILVNEPPTHDSPVEVIVLLIDSGPSPVEVMARALTQSDMRVVVADRISGADGAAQHLRTHSNVGVVVLDPETVPGRDNLAELKEAGLPEDVQVILVAEPVMLSRHAQNARGEIADFLPKPVARGTLLRAVLEAQKRHLSQGERAEALQNPQQQQIERLFARASLSPARRMPSRETSGDLKLLQLVEDIAECRTGALVGILEPDASWSMMAELMRARLSRRQVSVTSLCPAF